MQSNAVVGNTFENANSNLFARDLLEGRVEALRALATLMLREVDSLEKVVQIADHAGAEFGKNDFCLQSEVQRYEADLIRNALIKAQGSQRQAARLLGVKATTLNAKIKKYDINWRVVGIEGEFLA